jgi:hypothetical protein
MLDVKEATQRASEYFGRLFADQGTLFTNVQLEEVELTDDGQYWLITLSYGPTTSLTILGNPGTKYKVFKIDAGTGEVKSMKIRNLN